MTNAINTFFHMGRKIFVASVVAIAISVVINVTPTYAQTSQAIRVDVPFAFTANNKTFPAGTYIISPATDNRVMWTIQNAYQKPGALLMARSVDGTIRSGNVQLTFRRIGDRNFLISFNTSAYLVELPTSGSE